MRKSISVALFSMVSTLLVLGIAVMGCSEWVLFGRYFAQERYEALDGVADVARRTADYVVQNASLPEGEELEVLNARLEIIGESAEACLFFTDPEGRVMLSSSSSQVVGTQVPLALFDEMEPQGSYHLLSNLEGVLAEKSYVSVSQMRDADGQRSGYLFLCSSGARLEDFRDEFFSNFFLSACLMLLFANIACGLLMRRITVPLQKISDAAQRFGGGDLAVRVEGVTGEGEIADLARTFNTMAENIQTTDNSRGQFMGNIAHELRTPMTTIKGFIDGMLDGTIPQEENHHYLTIVSQETGRLARLVQNMLDITKLEAGEVPVHARNYDLWKTITDVVLSDEQRIEDGKIDIQGLGGPPMMICADPDFVHQVVYNIVDNAIKFTPEGGTISFAAQRKGDMVEVRIENSGSGIAPEALPFVFERFYKEDRSRGMNTRGSGLGLHICKILVNLSGGQIHAESEEGKWCRFVFTLRAAN